MNIQLIIHYGNKEVINAYRDFPKDKLDTSGACGVWSVKDILAHVASYEHLLEEVLGSFVDSKIETPHMKQMAESYEGFNEKMIDASKSKSFDEIMEDYTKTQKKILPLIQKISSEDLSRSGTIPWYGEEYALDDYIVYSNYGHKKEHMAQVAAFLSK